MLKSVVRFFLLLHLAFSLSPVAAQHVPQTPYRAANDAPQWVRMMYSAARISGVGQGGVRSTLRCISVRKK